MDDLDHYNKAGEYKMQKSVEDYWIALFFPALYWLRWTSESAKR